MNQTPSRQTALEQIKAGKITYDPRTGGFAQDGRAITGARRRTFAELRAQDLTDIARDDQGIPREGDGVLRLTVKGGDLLAGWQVA